MENANDLINKIWNAYKSGQFYKYIEYIRFPLFKNLEEDTQIDFQFPLTTFIGPNGSGKSSALHALYGAPKGNSPSYFWFETVLDPIKYDKKAQKGKRTSLIYAYRDEQNNIAEALKIRIYTAKGLTNVTEYWEPSRPLKWAGMKTMKGERNPQIEKDVCYLDFRAELSSFDKYFYFNEPIKRKTFASKQDYLREKSKKLKQLVDGRPYFLDTTGNRQLNKEPYHLNEEELSWVCDISGKEYKGALIIEHKLFQDWGFSVYFNSDNKNYSEAAAGSGEVVIVRLVTEILNAPDYSLILLDEPEVSLHPGAQKRLMRFLLDQIKRKKHQVVLSTHSPSLIEDLPKEAINVFHPLPSGKFNVSGNHKPEEAFYFIEQPNPNTREIVVEDQLAKDIVETVLEEMGEQVKNSFKVTYRTGGESVLKTDFIRYFSQEDEWNKFVLFDGDQEPAQLCDPTQLTQNELTVNNLREEIRNQIGCNVRFKPDSDDNDKELRLMKNYLSFCKSNIYYLPHNTPEEIIWNKEVVSKLPNLKEGDVKEIDYAANFKEKIRLLTEKLYDDDTQIKATHQMLIKNWADKKPDSFTKIKDAINTIREQ